MIRKLLLDRAASHGSSLALRSPAQNIAWTYEELVGRVRSVAGELTRPPLDGSRETPRVAMRLDNAAENIVVQLACALSGVPLHTYKTPEALMEAQRREEGKVQFSILAAATADAPGGHLFNLAGGFDGAIAGIGSAAPSTPLAQGGEEEVRFFDFEDPSAFYNSPRGAAFDALAAQGLAMGEKILVMGRDEVVVPITLCHAFGMTGAFAALSAGCGIALPSPAPDAAATLTCLEGCGGEAEAGYEQAVLLADSHTLKALVEGGHAAPSRLRAGLVKVGSGEVLGLGAPVNWSGVAFTTVGKPS